jgi:hypothetical protein
MRVRVCLAVLAVLVMTITVSSTAQAGTILFTSDRDPSADQDVYIMRDDGTTQTQFTDEDDDAERPSYTLDSRNVVFTNSVTKQIYMRATTGTTSQDLTGFEFPCEIGCEDPDAGPYISGSIDKDFRLVFTKEVSEGGGGDAIWIGTVDVSLGRVVDAREIVPYNNHDSYQPAWCGSSHIVWSRSNIECGGPGNPCGINEDYPWELCTIEVDHEGLVVDGTERCVMEDLGNQYPNCGVSDGVLTVVWGQGDGDTKEPITGEFIEGPHEICRMPFTNFDPFDIDDVQCFSNPDDPDNLLDDNKPVLSPDGNQMSFTTNRDGDYDIWVMMSNGDSPQPLTSNNDTDDDPDWGGSVLP